VSGWGPAGCWSGWGRWCIGCSYRHEDGRLHCTETDWPPIKAMPCPRFQVPHAPNPNPLHYTHKHRTPHSQCLMGVTLTLFLCPPGLSPLPLPLGEACYPPPHYTHTHRTPHSQCLMGVTLTRSLWPSGLSPLPLPPISLSPFLSSAPSHNFYLLCPTLFLVSLFFLSVIWSLSLSLSLSFSCSLSPHLHFSLSLPT